MNHARLLLVGAVVLGVLLVGTGHPYPGAIERAEASQPMADGDGLLDTIDPQDPQPVEDLCPALAEDPDGVDDQDGCPDTDVSVSVDKDEAYTVTVSVAETKTVDIWIQNGNYAADILVHLLAVSTVGVCEVTLSAEAGDQEMGFVADEDGDTVGETLHYLLEWEISLGAGDSRYTSRDYEVVCFLAGDHSFEIQVDAVPLPPVKEEDVEDLTNVHKNFPVLTVIDPTAADADGDGFDDELESFVGTMPLVACAATLDPDDEQPDAWPVDNNDDQKATVTDMLRYISVFLSSAPGPPYDSRYDLNTDGKINVTDILRFIPFFLQSCG